MRHYDRWNFRYYSNRAINVSLIALFVVINYIVSFPERLFRLIWNRGLKLLWCRLWIRKDEFHYSLDMDAKAVQFMTERQREKYLRDLIWRRQIAHERDLEN